MAAPSIYFRRLQLEARAEMGTEIVDFGEQIRKEIKTFKFG